MLTKGMGRGFGRRLLIRLLIGWAGFGPAQAEPVDIQVGGYVFPPYVDVGVDGQARGLSLDLIAALNQHQQEYRFRFVLTSSNRRYADFAAGRFDLILFEDLRWGWANTVMTSTAPLVQDSDRFVTGRLVGRDQDYFAELCGKQIFAVRGYHYAFANFDADPDALASRFKITLLDPSAASLERGLQQVANGQTELMIVTDSYLQHYLAQRPAMRERLLRAATPDGEYRLGALVRQQPTLDAAGFDALLAGLRANGSLQALAGRYGISQLLEPVPAR